MESKLNILVPEIHSFNLGESRGGIESMTGRRAVSPLSNKLRDEGGIEFTSIHLCFFCSGIHHVYIFCGILGSDMMFRGSMARDEG